MVAISVGCNGTIQNLDRSLKLEIFQGISQVKQMTSQMVSETTGL